MKLHEILIKCQELVDAATISFELNSDDVCREELGDLYDFLDDAFGSGARDKYESTDKEIDVIDLQEGDKYHDL